MTKRTTIEAIRTLNPTASPDFLAEFSPDELTEYLERLNRSSPEPRIERPIPSQGDRKSIPIAPDEWALE